MIALAGPVVLAEIGWVSMGIVDTIMVGGLGPEAIGAVGIGSSLFMAIAIFGMGLLLGLDTLVSHAFGAGRLDECREWLTQGLWLGLMVAVPLLALSWLGLANLWRWGFQPGVLDLTRPYLAIITWSLLPLLLYASLRRYLQAMNLVAPVTFALVSANLINALVNWVLIGGHLGAPALGTSGAAWATLISRIYMAAVLIVAVLRHHRRAGARAHALPVAPDWARLRRLIELGLPAATQLTLELGVFSAATALAGRLDAVSLAAHQIVLHLASFTFMIPLGLSSAGAVRVGHAIGRGDRRGARRTGWTAIALGIAFMTASALAFLLVPRQLIAMFTPNASVITTGTTLLAIAALFQPFDGVQGVTTGVLRGLGETRLPMTANLAGHWLIGLPLGYFLCFVTGWGIAGLWSGLAAGLMIVGVGLLVHWWSRAAALAPRRSPAPDA